MTVDSSESTEPRDLSQEDVNVFLAGVMQPRENISPMHYRRWKIQPIDFISANNLDFLRGNIIKYIMRYDAKGGIEDLKKALVYLDKLIEKVENKK